MTSTAEVSLPLLSWRRAHPVVIMTLALFFINPVVFRILEKLPAITVREKTLQQVITIIIVPSCSIFYSLAGLLDTC